MYGGIWHINTPASPFVYAEGGIWSTGSVAAGGGGGGGGGGTNDAINRVFPSPNSRLWTTFAGRVSPVP